MTDNQRLESIGKELQELKVKIHELMGYQTGRIQEKNHILSQLESPAMVEVVAEAILDARYGIESRGKPGIPIEKGSAINDQAQAAIQAIKQELTK